MEKWMDKNITGEGAKTSPVQTGSTRRSPRVQGKQDKEVHSIPCRKGIKLMSEREANETAEHGEVLRWSTDSGEEEYPQTTMQTVEQALSDSEEPTEFGMVWERFVIRETEDILGVPSTAGLEITTRNEDSVGFRGSNASSPTAVTKITMEDESPIFIDKSERYDEGSD
jgi:beta-lactam-binding protein with PASTA domain